jgi:NADPH:quinone reductase-like Zn-dependent oxidoreductase
VDFFKRVKTVELPNSLGKSEVLVKMVAAPINPADINLIEGVYGTKPTVPAVAGSEGMGIVVEKGNDVHGLNLTDHVIPVKAAGESCLFFFSLPRCALLQSSIAQNSV